MGKTGVHTRLCLCRPLDTAGADKTGRAQSTVWIACVIHLCREFVYISVRFAKTKWLRDTPPNAYFQKVELRRCAKYLPLQLDAQSHREQRQLAVYFCISCVLYSYYTYQTILGWRVNRLTTDLAEWTLFSPVLCHLCTFKLGHSGTKTIKHFVSLFRAQASRTHTTKPKPVW